MGTLLVVAIAARDFCHVKNFPVQFAEMAVVALMTGRVAMPTLDQFCMGVLAWRLATRLLSMDRSDQLSTHVMGHFHVNLLPNKAPLDGWKARAMVKDHAPRLPIMDRSDRWKTRVMVKNHAVGLPIKDQLNRWKTLVMVINHASRLPIMDRSDQLSIRVMTQNHATRLPITDRSDH